MSDLDPDAQHHMRLLVDQVPSMLAYWDSQLLCRFANQAYERWFGVCREKLLGTSIRDLLGPELFAKNEPYIRGALAGKRQIFERIVPGPGGVQRNSLAEYIPHIVDGVVQGFMVQVTELTELTTRHAVKQGFQFGAALAIKLIEDQTLNMGQVTIRSTSQNTKVEWMPTLDVSGKRFLLNKAHTSVGRDASADIQIDDNGLSRKHFEIVWDGKNAAGRDLRSTNGTSVNGKKWNRVGATTVDYGRTCYIGLLTSGGKGGSASTEFRNVKVAP